MEYPSDHYAQEAAQNARWASEPTGDPAQGQAHGLAAVAYSLLAVASAIQEAAQKKD
ncbi:hypothetical protein ABZ752_22745 [Streptomyces roseifaciens]